MPKRAVAFFGTYKLQEENWKRLLSHLIEPNDLDVLVFIQTNEREAFDQMLKRVFGDRLKHVQYLGDEYIAFDRHYQKLFFERVKRVNRSLGAAVYEKNPWIQLGIDLDRSFEEQPRKFFSVNVAQYSVLSYACQTAEPIFQAYEWILRFRLDLYLRHPWTVNPILNSENELFMGEGDEPQTPFEMIVARPNTFCRFWSLFMDHFGLYVPNLPTIPENLFCPEQQIMYFVAHFEFRIFHLHCSRDGVVENQAIAKYYVKTSDVHPDDRREMDLNTYVPGLFIEEYQRPHKDSTEDKSDALSKERKDSDSIYFILCWILLGILLLIICMYVMTLYHLKRPRSLTKNT